MIVTDRRGEKLIDGSPVKFNMLLPSEFYISRFKSNEE
jgi:hypothetical protein